MQRYPILFGLRDLIQGDGFLAAVAMEGRALMHEEEDGYVWVEGVTPGGFAGTGNNPAEALESFRREYTAALDDMAEEAKSFEGFKVLVEAFFRNVGEIPERDWLAAVDDVRAGRIDADWMTRRDANTPPRFTVVEIRQPAARNNELEQGPALAA